MADTAIQRKSFFQKPESITTILSFIAIGLLGFMFLDQILPLVNRVLEYALETVWRGVLLAGSIFLLTVIATNKEWHLLAWHFYQLAMRAITTIVVDLDPIGIMKNFLKKLRANREDMSQALGALKGQASGLEDKIRDTAKEIQRRQGLAVQAHKSGAEKKMQFVLQSRKAGRLEDSNMTYQGLYNRMRAHIAIMEKMLEASDFMIEDISDTIEVETEKRNMIRASHKAMSAAKSILQANAQREMYDLAMESVTKDYKAKIGEIEQFMYDSKNFISTMDLENGVYEAEALAKIEEWTTRSTNLLTGGTGKTTYQLEAPKQPNFAEQDRAIQQSIERGSFADLFDKLDK